MFKSKLEENAEGGETLAGDEDGLCYEIVKETSDEKPLTLEEARRLVEENYFLNRGEMRESCDILFVEENFTGRSALEVDYGAQGDIALNDDDGTSADGSSSDEMPSYVGRGYGVNTRRTTNNVEDDSPLSENDEIVGIISRNIPPSESTPLVHFGKGPPPAWSNVFDVSSDEESDP